MTVLQISQDTNEGTMTLSLPSEDLDFDDEGDLRASFVCKNGERDIVLLCSILDELGVEYELEEE